MKLSEQENKRFTNIIKKYADDELVKQMENFIQHGAVTTLDHCYNVARVSFWLNNRMHIYADERALMAGAFLHDFYLYDWHYHGIRNGLHGFTHPEQARVNAVKHFHISEKEQHIIRSHMWPLTLLNIPKNKEAVIVCIADKYCSAHETLFQRKRKKTICG